MEGDMKATKVKERHLVSAFKEIGLNAHTIEPSRQVKSLLQRYSEIDRSREDGISTPCSATLGDLRKIFSEEGIDTMVIYDGTQEGEATILGTLVGFADVATTVGLSVATKTVIPRSTPAKQTYNAVTANHLSILTSDGNISHYYSVALPRQNEPLYESERVEITKQLVILLMDGEKLSKATAAVGAATAATR